MKLLKFGRSYIVLLAKLSKFVFCATGVCHFASAKLLRQSRNQATKCAGHSLFELLLALLLLSILLTLTLVAWHPFVASNQLRVLTQRVVQAIYYARHYGISHQQNVRLCGSGDGKQCDGNWNAALLVVDKNADILQHFPAMPAGYRLLWRGNFAWNEAVTFTPEGFTQGQQGSFYFCPPVINQRYARALVLSFTGRVRLKPWDLAIEQQCYATASGMRSKFGQ